MQVQGICKSILLYFISCWTENFYLQIEGTIESFKKIILWKQQITNNK